MSAIGGALAADLPVLISAASSIVMTLLQGIIAAQYQPGVASFLGWNLFQTPWVSADPTDTIVSGLRPTLVRISVNPNAVALGVHDTTLYFVPSNGANTVPVRVRLIVTEPAKLLASRSRLEFRYRIGETPPPAQQLYVISTTGQFELSASTGGRL